MTAPYTSPLAGSYSVGNGAGTYQQQPTALQYGGGQQPRRRPPGQPDPNATPQQRGPSQSTGPAAHPAASAPAPTFAELQASGRARPAPPPTMQTMAPGGVPGQLAGSVSQALAQPSTYTSDAVMRSYGRLSQDIDDSFSQKETALREEMARRGLADSSIQGGRLQDLNVAHRSAAQELATQLLDRQAQTGASDRLAAIQAALGYTGQQQQGDQFNANLALQSELGRGNLGLQCDQLGLSREQLAQQNNQFGQSLGLQYAQLGQDANQFQQSFGLQSALGYGNLNLQQNAQNNQNAQYYAGLNQNAQQFAANDYRQGQQIGLQGSAQQNALLQSGAGILAQIANMPGLGGLLKTTDGKPIAADGSNLSAEGRTIWSSLQSVFGSFGGAPTTTNYGTNPYVPGATGSASGSTAPAPTGGASFSYAPAASSASYGSYAPAGGSYGAPSSYAAPYGSGASYGASSANGTPATRFSAYAAGSAPASYAGPASYGTPGFGGMKPDEIRSWQGYAPQSSVDALQGYMGRYGIGRDGQRTAGAARPATLTDKPTDDLDAWVRQAAGYTQPINGTQYQGGSDQYRALLGQVQNLVLPQFTAQAPTDTPENSEARQALWKQLWAQASKQLGLDAIPA